MKLEQEDLGKRINVVFDPQKLSEDDIEAQRIPYDAVISGKLGPAIIKYEEPEPTSNIQFPKVRSVNPYYAMKALGANECETKGELEEITDTYFKIK